MTRRGGRLTRVLLRLGLLLGGVLAAWAGHEVAAADAAYAADRPPVIGATLDLVSGVLRPALGTAPHAAAHGPAIDAAARRTAPLPPPVRTVVPPKRAAPRPPVRPAGPTQRRLRPPPATPTTAPARARVTRPADRVTTPPRTDRPRDTIRPAPARAPTPKAGLPSRVTEPVRTGILAPVANALKHVTGPRRTGILPPVARALRPVIGPLAPVLEPVLEPLLPVLTPLEPVTDPPDPATDPPDEAPPPATGGPRPGPIDPIPPPATTAVSPTTTGPAAAIPGCAEFVPNTPAARSPSKRLEPEGPHPLRSDADSTPAQHIPGSSKVDLSGGGHGTPADASAEPWASPVLPARRCHPPDGEALRSRSPRPDTRPA